MVFRQVGSMCALHLYITYASDIFDIQAVLSTKYDDYRITKQVWKGMCSAVMN